MRLSLVFFLAMLFISCGEDAPEMSWSLLKSQDGSLPIVRHEAAFVGVGDIFYLIGGRGNKPTSIFFAKSHTWRQGKTPPLELHHFQPVVYNDTVYIIGAMTGPYPTETPVPNIIQYVPSSDTWIIGDSIPADRRRGGAGASLYNDKIYLSCGIKNGHIGDHKKWLDAYDLKTKKWTVLPDAPRPRDHFQSVIHEDKLYLAAGRTTMAEIDPFAHTIAEVDVFDLKKNAWSTIKNNLPTTRAGNMAIAYNGDILIIGGESDHQERAHNEVEALSSKTSKWRSLDTLEEGRHGSGVVLYQNQLFIASGCGNRGGHPELNTVEVFSINN